jgi:HSP20 family protein
MANILLRRNGVRALDPWHVLNEMGQEMDRLMTAPFPYVAGTRPVGSNSAFVPALDLYETENEYTLIASLPGMDSAKLGIEVENNTLTISGEQKPFFTPESDTNLRAHLSNIPRYGKFSFSVKLPQAVNHAEAEARYVDGILNIRFPKLQKPQPIRIAINNDTPAASLTTVPTEAIESASHPVTEAAQETNAQ